MSDRHLLERLRQAAMQRGLSVRTLLDAAELAVQHLPESEEVPARVGRYAVLGRIGEGGMGMVYRALDLCTGRRLVLKVMRAGRQEMRFLREARITARLTHPGVVPVFDQGRLPDGRPWYAMQEIEGRTLDQLIVEAHAPEAAEALPERLPELVEAVRRVCETVAHAHERGVVHRDVKPENIMVEDTGFVRLLDWGIARDQGDPDEPLPTFRAEPGRTSVGTVLGTPGFASPEQLAGAIDRVGPLSDVFALGATLYAVLTGRPPAEGDPEDIIDQLVEDPPPPPSAACPVPLPEELDAACLRAISVPRPQRGTAAELAKVLTAWRRRTFARRRAEARLAEARSSEARLTHLARREEQLRRAARHGLAGLPPLASHHDKAPWWAQQARADAIEVARAVEGVRHEQALLAALGELPGLPEAESALSTHFLRRHQRLERTGQHEQAAAALEELVLYDVEGTHAAWVDGAGEITLTTDPPGARVRARRCDPEEGWGELEHPVDLGVTPLTGVSLEMGSWLLELTAPHRHPLRVPIQLGRCERWTLEAPVEHPHVLKLPPTDAVAPDEVWIAAGWFTAGGTNDAVRPHAARRLWLDTFVIHRDPVTVGGWARFCTATGRQPPTGDPALPAVHLSWHEANAYARWLAETTGLPWRLPTEWEWEKAARGVDARSLPWGAVRDAQLACTQESPGPRPAPVDAYPTDVSVYDVRGMGGNVMDWCLEPGGSEVPPTGTLPALPAPVEAETRRVRGGSWTTTSRPAICASRLRRLADLGFEDVGFRLVRSVGRD